MELNDLLTTKEIGALHSFTNNETMMEAVKKVLFASIYFEGTIRKEGIAFKNFTLDFVRGDRTNEEMGADLRAAHTAIKILEHGYQCLGRFRELKKQDKLGRNPAR